VIRGSQTDGSSFWFAELVFVSQNHRRRDFSLSSTSTDAARWRCSGWSVFCTAGYDSVIQNFEERARVTTSKDRLLGVASLEELYAALPALDLEPLWTVRGALTPTPATRMVPHVWRYDDVRQAILVAGDLISAEDADRRVLAFKNPGTAAHEVPRTSDTLWAAIQMVLPGEVAPPHRHSPAALRFVIEGSGAYTAVDGRRYALEPGDVCITPSWSWHEHGHEGEGPMLWLDGLDLPMVSTLRLGFAEFEGGPEVAESDAAGAADQPSMLWKLEDVRAALSTLRDGPADPFDDVIFEYTDPATGGPLLQTISAFAQTLRARCETQEHRHSSSAVYHVVEGEGSTVVDGQELRWGPRDTFVVPTWARHHHVNDTAQDALLFSFTDAPLVDALGLLREDAD
jgi:gentisate 1,2-dioxygenase